MLDHLEAAPAGKFDATYIEQHILAHKETVDLMTGICEMVTRRSCVLSRQLERLVNSGIRNASCSEGWQEPLDLTFC